MSTASSTRMGVYQQHFVDRLPMDKTAVQHLRDRFQDQDYQSIRNRLGKYGLEGHAHEVSMRDLSGGQKARVVFVELSLQRPHVLLLGKICYLPKYVFVGSSNRLSFILSLVK
jgi:ATP-binding cassette subfamily F protein 1